MSDPTELNVDHDNLVSHMTTWAEAETSANSEAAGRRAEIKQFLDDHPGLHKKALSDIRRIDKMDDDKRDDYFRSFDKLRETLSGNWEGQKTPDMFVDGENVSEPEDGDAIPAFGDDADEFPA